MSLNRELEPKFPKPNYALMVLMFSMLLTSLSCVPLPEATPTPAQSNNHTQISSQYTNLSEVEASKIAEVNNDLQNFQRIVGFYIETNEQVIDPELADNIKKIITQIPSATRGAIVKNTPIEDQSVTKPTINYHLESPFLDLRRFFDPKIKKPIQDRIILRVDDQKKFNSEIQVPVHIPENLLDSYLNIFKTPAGWVKEDRFVRQDFDKSTTILEVRRTHLDSSLMIITVSTDGMMSLEVFSPDSTLISP